MAIGYIKRLAGPYIGDGTGQKTFSFGFFVFTEGDVYVATAATESGAPSTLQQGTDYTVTLNSDQEASPGGTITLTAEAGLADGAVLAIGSDVDYTQTLDLTNYTRFPPARISKELDRIVVQIQQLVGALERTVTVDVTDPMTPQELKQKLLDAAKSASVVANGYAKAAQASAEAAAGSAKDAADSAATVDAKGREQKNRVTEEGDTQVKRLQDMVDSEAILAGVAGGERTWTLQTDVAAGTAISIPDGLSYLVGRHHLRVSWNGLVLYPSENFNEIGDADSRSQDFNLTFDARAGDVLDAWVGALGTGAVADAIEASSAAQDAVADLSRRVVYKNQSSAED